MSIFIKSKYFKIFKICIIASMLGFGCKCIVDYILPVEYEELIEKYCKQYDLDKGLVYSVINAESRFEKSVQSHKGAIGLMQIMPQTGAWLSEKMEISPITSEDLYIPTINIQVGCFYIRYLLDKYDDEMLALCAYNAGSTNVYKWLKDDRYSENGRLHTIPFGETDRYIKKIKLLRKGYNILFMI